MAGGGDQLGYWMWREEPARSDDQGGRVQSVDREVCRPGLSDVIWMMMHNIVDIVEVFLNRILIMLQCQY